ncbi:MAG TPA: hypothetical protein VM802_24215 [Chitinophaga sp.]|uniref:hypothetical protein n=1 Tax=Chitinophaga sp. TaxID=1869181 RepID=UPI002BCE10AF|nr:hypothetical protein [Chitinophaga sp.]HVI47995.1 hypothetical protein [Chitinophaga sp.]
MNYQQYIAGLRPDNPEFEKFINDYGSRQALATAFIPTEVFIQQEIERINHNIKNHKLFNVDVSIGPFQTARPFQHSICATIVFEALMSGRNLTVGQIIETAKAQAEITNRKTMQWGVGVEIGEEFQTTCYNWIKSGIVYVYYIQYLYKKMKDHTLTVAKFILVLGDGNVITMGNDNHVDAKITIDKASPSKEGVNRASQDT